MGQERFSQKYGPWAIVTGASSGLGAELAGQLAERGLHLVIVARRKDRLRELAERLERDRGIATRILALDLAHPDACTALEERTADLDVGLLVNNAGFSRTGELLQSTVEQERLMYRVNCEVPLALAMAFGARLAKRGQGGIMFISSSVAYASFPYWTHYAATKSYLLRLGEGMYAELKKSGVDVLTVCPGGMKTELQEVAGISDFGAMDVKPVAKQAIRSLGRRPSVVPGWFNKLTFQFLPKLLPSRFSLSLFGAVMKKLATAK